jgi:tryptophan 2,3-dioxygenase
MTGRACSHNSAGSAAASIGYSDYLQLPALLSLQRPLGAPQVPDELLFIIVHQTHELWFKQLLQDLTLLVSHLDADAWDDAAIRLDRLVRILRLLVDHLDVLSSMPASEFQGFRTALGTASGMQSEQYREIERLAGGETEQAPPVAGAARSSVRFAFLHALGRAHAAGRGAASPNEATEAGPASQLLTRVWHSPDLVAERAVAERLTELDEQMAVWRGRHATLAQQMIGDTAGTGGSLGVRYLEEAVARRFFPELHAAASQRG